MAIADIANAYRDRGCDGESRAVHFGTSARIRGAAFRVDTKIWR